MPLDLAPSLLAAQAAQSTGEVALFLLTIEHPSLPGGVLRFTNNTETVTSRGQPYEPFPFLVPMPTYSNDGPPRAQITIDNVHQAIPTWIFDAEGEVWVTVEVVAASEPDIAAQTSGRLLWASASSDDPAKIDITVGGKDLRRASYPRRAYTPDRWQALHRAS